MLEAHLTYTTPAAAHPLPVRLAVIGTSTPDIFVAAFENSLALIAALLHQGQPLHALALSEQLALGYGACAGQPGVMPGLFPYFETFQNLTACAPPGIRLEADAWGREWPLMLNMQLQWARRRISHGDWGSGVFAAPRKHGRSGTGKAAAATAARFAAAPELEAALRSLGPHFQLSAQWPRGGSWDLGMPLGAFRLPAELSEAAVGRALWVAAALTLSCILAPLAIYCEWAPSGS